MFVDFNSIFNNKPQTQRALPPAFVEHINGLLPKGIRYFVDDNNNFVITSTEEICKIGGFIFEPTDDQIKVLGDNYSGEDVINYVYNAQKPVPLKLEKEGHITLNGEYFPVDKVSFNPLVKVNRVNRVSDSFALFPPDFPPPFQVEIGCGEYKRMLSVKRVPNESVTIQAFESCSDDALHVKYFVDEKNKSFSVKMSLNLSEAKSVRDIVESASIFNGFIDGNGAIANCSIDGEIDENAKKFDAKSLWFWEKVLKIENHLGVAFIPEKGDIGLNIAYQVEQLYQNLIMQIPIREDETIDTVDGNWSSIEDVERITNKLQQPVYLEFAGKARFELFGVSIELPIWVSIFNAVPKEFITDSNPQRLILADMSAEAKRYTATRCFANKEDLETFKKGDYDKRFQEFHDAKRLEEYL